MPGHLWWALAMLTLSGFALQTSSYTRLAAIGDFGADANGELYAKGEALAASIVVNFDKRLRLDGILALGDVNYPGSPCWFYGCEGWMYGW